MTTSQNSAIPSSHADLLHRAAYAHVATIGPNGEPHSSPVWFGWDGATIAFSNTKARQKYRNVQRESRVALSIMDPDDAYRYMEIRGRVVAIEDDPDRAFIDSMAQKYLGLERYPWHQEGDERVVIRIAPEQTTTMGRKAR